jgi:hypothetical protein
MRIDGVNAPVSPATISFSRAVIGVNGSFTVNNGFHSLKDHITSTGNWQTHSISGVMKLSAGDYVSVGLLCHSDASWTYIGESGFTGYLITRQ